MNWMVEDMLKVWDKMPHNHVMVDMEKLHRDCFAAVERGQEFKLPRWDFPGIHPQSHEAFARYVFWMNVINYNFSHPVKTSDGKLLKYKARDIFGKIQSGAFAMGAVLYRAFREEPILSKHIRPRMETLRSARRFFKGYNSPAMIGERREMLLLACDMLDENFYGDPKNIFELAKYRAIGDVAEGGKIMGLTDILNLGFGDLFADEYEWPPNSFDNDLLRFFKRLNLLIVMYHDRAVQSNGELTPIVDIHKVGPIPDYELPRSYEADGIFKYSQELLSYIDNAQPIKSSSPMELEIRLATVVAQYWELRWLNEARAVYNLEPLHIGHSDFYRWYRGKKVNGRLPHVCLTTDY